MRISDWSSDVCSSDLQAGAQAVLWHVGGAQPAQGGRIELSRWREPLAQQVEAARGDRADAGEQLQQLALAVAGDAGDAADPTGARDKSDMVDPRHPAPVDESEAIEPPSESRRGGNR